MTKDDKGSMGLLFKLGIGFISLAGFVSIVLLVAKNSNNENVLSVATGVVGKQNQSENNSGQSDNNPSNLELNKIILYAVSPADRQAAIRVGNKDSKIQIIKVGDYSESLGLTVEQITHDKLVIKEQASSDIFFIFLADENGVSKKQKISSQVSSISKPAIRVVVSD